MKQSADGPRPWVIKALADYRKGSVVQKKWLGSSNTAATKTVAPKP